MARKRKTTKRRKKRARLRWLKGLGLIAIAGGISVVAIYWHFSRGLPSVDALRKYEPPQTSRVYDRGGRVIGEIFDERRTVIPLSKIPRAAVLAVLAAEDADFYEHSGLDYTGILRAIIRDVLSGRAAQGGSTITQQVVKLMLLTPERTVTRKIKELILARRLERALSKDEILHLYMNHVNFGRGRYGIEEAAKFYFAKSAEQLSLAEAAMLAGVPQAPSRLSPRKNYDAAKSRQLYVLGQLSAKRAVYWPDLNEQDIATAREAAVELADPPTYRSRAPEIMAIAKRTLRDAVGEEAMSRGGYSVHTTIDLDAQRKARAALRRGLRDIDQRQGYSGPSKQRRRPVKASAAAPDKLRMGRTYYATVRSTNDKRGTIVMDVAGHAVELRLEDAARYNPEALSASKFAKDADVLPVSIVQLGQGEQPAIARLERGPEGAVVVIETRTRELLALVGGYDEKTGFNRAMQAVRQPGSTFKPIVYSLAVKSRRFTPASLVMDAPAVYDEWKPSNYEKWEYKGAIRLREALAQSINMVAVRVTEEVGVKSVAEFARSLGITTKLAADMALGLGASGVLPIELTNAYATFAAGGRWAPPRLIKKITHSDGSMIPLAKPEEPRDVMTPAEAYLITDMLKSVVTTGTGAGARKLGRPVRGKTGTSNRARDAWFVGYSPRVVAGVWIGFDDQRPLGRRESGPRTALPIWTSVMKAAEPDAPNTDFAQPSGVIVAQIDPASGLLAYEGQEDAFSEVFLVGTAPTEVARPPGVADPNTFMMEQFGSSAAATGTTPQATPQPPSAPSPSDDALGGHAPP